MANERQRLLAVTIAAGGLCGPAAVAFHLSIAWLENLLINRANHAPGTRGSSGRFCCRASLGLQGPIVQICAGVRSLIARTARLSPANSPAAAGWH